MDFQEIEAKTQKLLEELRASEPIMFQVSGSFAYWMLYQFEVAQEAETNQMVLMPDALMFIEDLRIQILERCSPETRDFLNSIR